MTLTKKHYEALTPYKDQLRAAYKNSFLHMSGTDFIKVAAIYAEVFGQELRKSQMGCNTCRLNALRKLGELYEQYEKGGGEETEEGTQEETGRQGKWLIRKKWRLP